MLSEIRKTLLRNSSKEGKDAADKFVPGANDAYGVRLPVINELAKTYKSGGFALVEQLWKGKYEEKLLAAKILGKNAKKDPEKTIGLIRKFSASINDWAVCDTLGMQSPKAINKSHGDEIFSISRSLIVSKNLWQRRLALVLAEWHTRDKTRHPEIKALLAKVKDDKEYYVKKAVTWIEKNLKKSK